MMGCVCAHVGSWENPIHQRANSKIESITYFCSSSLSVGYIGKLRHVS